MIINFRTTVDVTRNFGYFVDYKNTYLTNINIGGKVSTKQKNYNFVSMFSYIKFKVRAVRG